MAARRFSCVTTKASCARSSARRSPPTATASLEARDGDDALAQARLHRPDVIVLDMMMPGRSGIDVLGELRADPELAGDPGARAERPRPAERPRRGGAGGGRPVRDQAVQPDRARHRSSTSSRASYGDAAALHPGLSDAAGIDLTTFRSDHVAERVRRAVEREGVADEAELARLLADRRRHAGASGARSRSPSPGSTAIRSSSSCSAASCSRRSSPPAAGCASGRPAARTAASCTRSAPARAARRARPRLPAGQRPPRREPRRGPARRVRRRRRSPPGCGRCARWEQRDLVRDPPRGKWNVILCRNVAIYFEPQAKAELHAALAASLAQSGVLLLGRSERIARRRRAGPASAGPNAYRRRP